MTSDYTTAPALKARLGINDSDDDIAIAAAIAAASRQIDSYCGRSFWQDDTVTTREFYAGDARSVDLLDVDGIAREISTATGLIVKTDEAGSGTYSTTLTISTDFLLLPRGAEADGRGYSEIWLADNYSFPRPSNGRAGVQVTAKFGWPSIPDEVEEACLVQAAQIFASRNAAFGQATSPDGAPMSIRWNHVAAALLQGVTRVAVG